MSMDEEDIYPGELVRVKREKREKILGFLRVGTNGLKSMGERSIFPKMVKKTVWTKLSTFQTSSRIIGAYQVIKYIILHFMHTSMRVSTSSNILRPPLIIYRCH